MKEFLWFLCVSLIISIIASFVLILSYYRKFDAEKFITSKSSIISKSPDSSGSCRPLFCNNGCTIAFGPFEEAYWYFSWLAALRLIFAKYSLRWGLLTWTRLRVSATSLDFMWKSKGASQAKLGLKFISNTQGLKWLEKSNYFKLESIKTSKPNSSKQFYLFGKTRLNP